MKALTKMKPSKKTMEWLNTTAKILEDNGYEVIGYTWTDEGFAVQLGGIVLTTQS